MRNCSSPPPLIHLILRIWAPKTGKCKHVFEGHMGHEGMVTCVVGSNDGDLILSGSVDGKVLLLSVGKKKVLQTFIHSKPKAVQGEGPSPNGAGPGSGSGSVPKGPEEDQDEETFGAFDEGSEDADDAEGTLSVECVGNYITAKCLLVMSSQELSSSSYHNILIFITFFHSYYTLCPHLPSPRVQ